ncbi:MAG: aldo/keto reductase [Candidatus Heimdallarchaeota archaeon]|nr:MAG: aldo/keto reductase [Candidatus Heimdallarchaeota archaeon]
MEFRQFGKTGHNASILTLGGCALGWLQEQDPKTAQERANIAIENAIAQGVNIIDVAPSYGEAEVRIHPWIQKIRNKIFLSEKTMERTKEGAWKELNRSLKRLGTSYFDLYQFHTVSTMEELEQIMGKDGAMEAFKEAKETDLIKNIGITCHSDMRIMIKALKSKEYFDTILIPVYVAAMAHPHPSNDFRPVLKLAQEKHIGVIAIKAISRRRWTFAKKYGTWYQPLDEQTWIDDAVGYTLSQEGVTTYSLPCDLRLWPLVLDAVKKFQKLGTSKQEEIIQRAKSENFTPLFPEK